MAGSYLLELELLGSYASDMPGFEIWEDGVLFSSYSISSSGTSISATINYGGTLPASLEFRFNDALPELGRTIEIRSVRIDNQYVNVSNYLSTDNLTNGSNAIVDVVTPVFLFDTSNPPLSEFTTLPTRTMTAGEDNFRDFNSITDEIFDALAGRDTIYLGDGNDKVFGNSGDDIIYAGGGDDLISGGDDNDNIYGGTGNDRLYGGNGNDRIHGEDGDDEIYGGAGNDTLNGHAGADTIVGGAGEDKINGGNDNDILYGGDDNDQIVGGNGDDTIDGGDGDDVAYGGAGDDTLNGGTGADYLIGNNGADIIDGGDGNDTILGGADNDILYGNTGDDTIYGGAGDDTIDGGADNDYINGEENADVIVGGAGNDVIVGGAGADTLDGGAGDDILHGHGLTAAEIRAILKANPAVTFNENTNSFYEYVASWATYTNAQIAANSEILNGVAGHLVNITTAAENVFVTGLLPGGIGVWTGGNDLVTEGHWVWEQGAEAGLNFWNGDSTGSSVSGMYENLNPGYPSNFNGFEDGLELKPGAGWESINHTIGIQRIIEWDASLMNDDNEIDILNGGDGNDHLYGYGGNDILNGGADNDVLLGGDGDDTLNGGTGNDSLHGGAGTDTAIFLGNWDDYEITLVSNTYTLFEITTGETDNTTLIENFQFTDTTKTTANIINYRPTITSNGGGTTADISIAENETAVTTVTATDIETPASITYSITGGVDASFFSITAGGVLTFLSAPDYETPLDSGFDNIYNVQITATDGDGRTDSQAISVQIENPAIDQVALILAANPTVYYNESTGNFYEFVNTSTNWTAASSAANARTLNGINGHLVVESSAEENGFITTISGGQRLWIGGSDTATEGEWFWDEGPEAGTKFWTGGSAGSAVGGLYSNWLPGDPSNADSGYDYIEHRADGTWWANYGNQFYVVEWEGDLVLGTSGTNILSGGDGSQTLYGTDGVQDIFTFISGETGIDTIENFTAADTDAIDISAVLTGYTAGASDINDFIQFINSGADTLVQVDSNGTTGGASFTTIAQISGINDLNADALIYNESILA